MTATPEDRDTRAGEYVLGTLDAREAAALEAQMARDPALADAVAAWRERLAPLDEAPAIAPSATLWPRIAASIETSRSLAAAPAAPARRNASTLVDLWESLRFWRMASLTGALATLALAIGLVVAVERQARTPVLVAVLLTETDQSPAAIVNAFADGRTELVPLRTIPVPEGRALEIWTLWDRQIGPRSVGLIGRARSTPLRVQNLPLGPDQLFEITLEPAGGSPIGRPTGPILMKGLTARAL